MEIEILPDQPTRRQFHKAMKRAATTEKSKKGSAKKPKDTFGIHKPLRSVKPELKYKDSVMSASLPPFGTWAGPTLLNGLQVGGSPQQRVGRKVTWTKMLVRCNFTATDPIAPTTDTRIRVLIIYDKQTNGANPTVTSVLAIDEFTSPMNLDNRDRYVILADVEVPQSVGLNNFSGTVTFNRKFNLETIYNVNGAGDVGDINTGAIFGMYCGNNVNFGTGISSRMQVRLRFLDY